MNSLQALPNKNCGVWISASLIKKSGFVLISVKDEGVGMTKDVIERATEPFFTTRLDRGGTGLGLSISYSIIKEHGGSLEFESEPGKGTTVSVQLPVYDER
jgi:signal transduction histidine kinase